MSKIKIFVDTAADMPKEMLEKYDIGLINFIVNFGDESFVAGKDITNEEFYEKIKNGKEMPKTSQTPYMDMYDQLLEAAKANDTVIYFTISSKASGQNHTASLVAEQIKEEVETADIRIVDTMTFSVYILKAVKKAAQAVNMGKNADEAIKEALDEIQKWGVYLLVDDLSYLERGGRINKQALIIGSLLEIKPILGVKDGIIDCVTKLRGKKKIMKKLSNLIEESPDFNMQDPEFLIIDSNEDMKEDLKNQLIEDFGENSIKEEYKFGPVIGAHAGPAAVAVLYKKK